jgi:prepilin-type N-terminal cleavage/methylation domain-containing protein
MRSQGANKNEQAGFTLVELLVVIGIIAMLMSLLAPALVRIREQAKSAQCKSNLKQIGNELVLYAHYNRGWMYPVGAWDGSKFESLGANKPPWGRWPVYVFKWPFPRAPNPVPGTLSAEQEKAWTPPIMLCPSDIEPPTGHSYILNKHLVLSPEQVVRFSTRVAGRSHAEIVLMGEKKVGQYDYYMELRRNPDPTQPVDPNISEFDDVVEPYKHGIKVGSNYLYLDLHVDIVPPKSAAAAVDPWIPFGQ